MGILIRVKDASFEANALAFIPPVADGLEYWNFFGVDDSKAKRNLAPGKPGANVVGAITHNANSVVLKGGSNYLVTAAQDSPEITLIAVAKPVADHNALLVSNFGSPRVNGVSTTYGKSLLFNAKTAGDGLVDVVQYASRWDGAGGASTAVGVTLPNHAVGSWCMLAGRVSEAAKTREVFNKTAGTYGQNALTLEGDLGSATLRIGSGYTATSHQNDSEIAAAIIYNRALSDAELTKVYDFLKSYYARRGIAI